MLNRREKTTCRLRNRERADGRENMGGGGIGGRRRWGERSGGRTLEDDGAVVRRSDPHSPVARPLSHQRLYCVDGRPTPPLVAHAASRRRAVAPSRSPRCRRSRSIHSCPIGIMGSFGKFSAYGAIGRFVRICFLSTDLLAVVRPLPS